VTVLLEDQFKWGNNRSFFDVTIDGEPRPKLAPEMGVTATSVPRTCRRASTTS
jgi:hypothetical protein